VQVADEAEVGHVEDRRVGIFVDGDDQVGTLHAGQMLTGAWQPVSGAGPRTGSGGTDALTDTNEPPKGPFYRLKVELP
jgi:hypothetical protein